MISYDIQGIMLKFDIENTVIIAKMSLLSAHREDILRF
jgi:hypothetical protein